MISATELAILTCESVGIDLLLEPADNQSHFNILVNLTCMSLDYETKPRVPGGSHKGMKNMQITHREAPARYSNPEPSCYEGVTAQTTVLFQRIK